MPIAAKRGPAESPAGGDNLFIETRGPENAASGRHVGTLQIGERTLPLVVLVWNFSLPDRLSLLPQMNCYGLPGPERDYYHLAHEHRTVLNRLPYGWTGRVNRKCAPVVRADGSWDWTAWDAQFGPLLDGSAFRDLPRAGVPVDAFYLRSSPIRACSPRSSRNPKPTRAASDSERKLTRLSPFCGDAVRAIQVVPAHRQ